MTIYCVIDNVNFLILWIIVTVETVYFTRKIIGSCGDVIGIMGGGIVIGGPPKMMHGPNGEETEGKDWNMCGDLGKYVAGCRGATPDHDDAPESLENSLRFDK